MEKKTGSVEGSQNRRKKKKKIECRLAFDKRKTGRAARILREALCLLPARPMIILFKFKRIARSTPRYFFFGFLLAPRNNETSASRSNLSSGVVYVNSRQIHLNRSLKFDLHNL